MAVRHILFRFLLFSAAISELFAEKRIVKVPRTSLDVALMFDEYVSVKRTNYKQVYDGLKQWIKDTFHRTNDTRFAVLGCGYITPRLLFRYGTVAETVIKQFPADIRGPRCNVQSGLTTVLEVIFQNYNGNRDEASNVLLFVTDCALGWDSDNAIANIAKKVRNKVEFFGIICLQVCENGKCRLINENLKPTIIKWLGHDENKLITFTNSSNFRNYLDTVLPTVDLQVQDCEYSDVISSGCRFNQTRNKCENTSRRSILAEGNPPEYAKMCLKSETEPIVTECIESECDCDKHPWIAEPCSVKCGLGIQISRRNISQNPTCNEIETNNCSVQCDFNSTSIRNETDQYFSDAQVACSCVTFVIFIIAAIAATFVLIGTIFIVLFRRRCQRVEYNLGRNKVKFSILKNDETKEVSVELNDNFTT